MGSRFLALLDPNPPHELIDGHSLIKQGQNIALHGRVIQDFFKGNSFNRQPLDRGGK